MFKALFKILDSGWTVIDRTGEFIENTIEHVGDGTMMLQEEAQIILSNYDKNGIVVSVLQFFNPASTLAETIYPVRLVEAKAKELREQGKHDESLLLTLDGLELRRWNYELRLSARKAITISPVKREIIDQFKKNIDNLNEDENFQEKYEKTLQGIRLYFEDKLVKSTDSDDAEILWHYITAVIKSSLLLSDIKTAKSYMEYLEESDRHLSEKYLLQGRIEFGQKNYQTAIEFLSKSHSLKNEHALDFIALVFDRWLTEDHSEEERIKIKEMRDKFDSRLSSSLGDLPLTLFQFKLWELEQIISKLTK